MKSFGKYMACAAAWLSIVTAHAGTSCDSCIAPPQVGGYWESKDAFYAEVDGGAVILNTPNKNNSNFFNDPGEVGLAGQTDALGSFKTNSTTGSIGGKFGYILSAKPADSWLGSNLRLEASGTYFETDTSDSGTASTADPATTAFWAESLNGQINSSNYYAIGASAKVSETTQDYFYEGGAALKSDYDLGHGALTFTPSLGLDYSHLGQHFETKATGNAGSLNQGEKVNTDYYGLKFGFELRANVSKQFIMFIDGGLSPMLAYSNYDGQQAINGGNGLTTSQANDNASEFTFHGNLDGGLAYDFGPVIFKLSGGFQYWDYAATVKEAELPHGATIPSGAPITAPSVEPSHLVGDSMLNPEVSGSIIVPF